MLYLLKTLTVIDVLMVASLLLFRWALVPRGRDVVSGKLFAIGVITPVVALFCGNIYLFCLYLVVLVAFNARSRPELAGTYLFLLPLMPIVSQETGVGGIYLLPVSTVAAMGLGALIGVMVTGGRRLPGLPRYEVALWVMVAIFIFIYNRAGNPTFLLRGLTTYLLAFAGPYMMMNRAPRGADDIERMLLRLCLGGVAVAVTACFQARRHWILFETYYPSLHVPIPLLSASLAMRAGLLRTGGSMVDYSAAGLFLASVLTLLPLLRHRFRPVGFWAVIAILISGLFVTQSRGAWVSAVVGFLFVSAYRGKWGRVVIAAGSAVAAELAVLTFAKSGKLAQILGRTQEASGNVTYRQTLFSQGLKQVRSHPLFGQPPEQIVAALSDLTQGEHIVDIVNTHLFIAMGAGLPLFAIWCLIWSMPVVEGWRHRMGDGGQLAVVPVAIIVPVMVALTFTSPGDRNLTWAMIALGLTAPCLAVARSPKVRRARVADTLAAPALALASL